MFLFPTKQVNVEFYLDKLKHNIISSAPFNFRQNINYAERILGFLHEYTEKRKGELHPIKLGHLKEIRTNLINFIDALMKKDKNEVLFVKLRVAFENYASSGSVYLLRHPDKFKVEGKALTPGKGRALSSLGVKQAKEFAEMIKEEILVSPKPVKVIIRTSEVNRTHLFANIIKQINKAHKLDNKKIEVSQAEDKRIFIGPVSENAWQLVELAVKKHGRKGELFGFKDWVRREGEFGEEIKKKGIVDPQKVRNDIHDFVKSSLIEIKDPTHYTLVLGISHSWMLDTFLYKYFGIEEIISTAEYAKAEYDSIYYKGRWMKL
ncbi:hypothetical protein ACFLZ7_04060 [Nanoarchaeota archaeon]